MFCMWSISDGKAGRPVAAYAERDDANARFVREKYFDSASIGWVNVPGQRIKEKFKGKDYCGEIAAGQATGVRSWLPEAAGKRGAHK